MRWIHEHSMIHGKTVKRQENGQNDGKINGIIQEMIKSGRMEAWMDGWKMKQRREMNVLKK